jgi:nitronate monooxygenase
MGADLAYMGTRFVATKEANAMPEYKQMIVDSKAEDIIYSSLFTGIHGNYLRGSIEKSGLDPNQLPEADKSTMNFGSGGNTHKKAWKDIWGAGQGVGAIHDIPDVATLVDRIETEYLAAKAKLCAG